MRFAHPATTSARNQLQHRLADPAAAALLAASPVIRRALRPLCGILGLPPPSEPSPTASRARQRVTGIHNRSMIVRLSGEGRRR